MLAASSTSPARRQVVAAFVLAMTLAVPRAGSAAIIATLEEPGASATGVSLVRGWAFTTIPGASIDTLVEVFVDGELILQAPCCSNRADVRNVFPQAPLLTGFGGVLNYDNLAPGSHAMAVVVSSSVGEQTTLLTTFAVIRPSASFTFLDSVQFANGAACVLGNSPNPPYFPAQIQCTGLAARRGNFVEVCPALNVFRWDRASQGFKLVLNQCALP